MTKGKIVLELLKYAKSNIRKFGPRSGCTIIKLLPKVRCFFQKGQALHLEEITMDVFTRHCNT